MAREYKESLESGGNLVATPEDWNIQYFFPGPDFRYNGKFVTITSFEVENCIKGFINNYKKYIELKQQFNDLNIDELTMEGEAGMNICLGKYRSGVCIREKYLPNSDEKSLRQIIKDYAYCLDFGPKIVDFLKDMSTQTLSEEYLKYFK